MFTKGLLCGLLFFTDLINLCLKLLIIYCDKVLTLHHRLLSWLNLNISCSSQLWIGNYYIKCKSNHFSDEDINTGVSTVFKTKRELKCQNELTSVTQKSWPRAVVYHHCTWSAFLHNRRYLSIYVSITEII